MAHVFFPGHLGRPTAILALLTLATASLTGCYNTYRVPQDEFRKLQSAGAVIEDQKLAAVISPEEVSNLEKRGENDLITVTDDKNEKVGVNRDTRLFVRSEGGRRYQVTPFNFSMISSQLVASDRDYLLPLTEVKSYEVDHFSTVKTVVIVSAGVAVAAALIVGILVSTKSSGLK